jgi:hypothetical protein
VEAVEITADLNFGEPTAIECSWRTHKSQRHIYRPFWV